MIVLIPLILLSGCGNNSRPSLDERIGSGGQEVQSSYEGVIERLGNLDVYQQGTHRLVTEDQESIIIQSPTIDLNQYLGENVLIKGTLEKGIGDAKDVFTVTAISYVDETKSAGSQDYESKTYGFKFSYPSTWILNEGQDELSLTLEEKPVVSITVFSSQTDLTAFASGRESSEPAEVTIGAQKALRYVSGTKLKFYVPNPPKEKIYLIGYTPVANSVDDKTSADSEKEQFYSLLDSFELIFLSQTEGDKCGGMEQVKCPEDQVCQLESDGKYAEGTCAPVGGEATSSNCPFIAPPAGCNQYRISEYGQKGCPSRYECVDAGSADSQAASYRDLNGENTGEGAVTDENAETSSEEVLIETTPDEAETEGATTEEKQYDVPALSSVTGVYANSRRGFSLLYPKSWYFASFGPVDGALWKVGFSNAEFEEPSAALITLSIMKDSGGSAYKKIGDLYYIVDGPADLDAVMKKMADSVEESQ